MVITGLGMQDLAGHGEMGFARYGMCVTCLHQGGRSTECYYVVQGCLMCVLQLSPSSILRTCVDLLPNHTCCMLHSLFGKRSEHFGMESPDAIQTSIAVCTTSDMPSDASRKRQLIRSNRARDSSRQREPKGQSSARRHGGESSMPRSVPRR